MNKVVVTGLGAVTPFGPGVRALWDGLLAGRPAIREIQRFDVSALPVRIAGEVPDFHPTDHMDVKTAKRTDRFAQFALAAAREAIDHAGLVIAAGDPRRVAAMVYTGGGGMTSMETAILTRLKRGGRAVPPLTIPLWAPNIASSHLTMAHGITGPALTGTGACAAGVMAYIDAVRLIEMGMIDVAIAGASEALLSPVMLAGFAATGALSVRNDNPAAACRPFDSGRDGTVLGEGSCMMVLESEAHAVRRGATAIAIASGGSSTSDAHHITAPSPDGMQVARAISNACRGAGITPDQVDYFSAHATGSRLGDVAENAAIHRAFGAHAKRLLVSSSKSMAGHLIGAAGALSSLTCVLAIRDGIVPPTINVRQLDPEIDLDVVRTGARKAVVRVAIANGLAFGGQNAATVFQSIS